MKETVKKHWAIIVFALVVGFIIVLPAARSIVSMGSEDFKGIYPIFNYDRLFYMSLTKDVYEGHLGLGNAYVQEHKNDPYVQPPLAEIILAGIARITDLNIPDLFFVLDFILPVIIVLLLYLIFYTLTKVKTISAGLAMLFTIASLEQLAMPINPQFSFIPFFAGVCFLIKAVIKPDINNNSRKIIYTSLAGLMTGILIYIYPFFWTSLFVLYFLFFAYNYIAEGRNIKYLKNIIYFLVPFFILSVPYLFNLFRAVQNPYYSQTMARYGLINTHWPGCYYNIAMLAITLIALVVSKKFFYEKKYWYSALCFIATAVILNWQNIITGKFMQFSTHYYRTTFLFSMMAFGLIFYNFLREKNSRIKKIIIVCLFLLFFALVMRLQYNYTATWLVTYLPKQEMTDLQKNAALFDWLNKNTTPDSTVYAINNQLLNYLTVYTHNNTYLPSYGAVNLMSDDELENRWLSQTIFNRKIDRKYIAQADVWVNKFIDQYQSQLVRKKIFSLIGIDIGVRATRVPPEYSAKLLRKYEEYRQGNPCELLKRYKLDYLVITDVDENYLEQKQIVDSLSCFQQVKALDHYYVYKML